MTLLIAAILFACNQNQECAGKLSFTNAKWAFDDQSLINPINRKFRHTRRNNALPFNI